MAIKTKQVIGASIVIAALCLAGIALAFVFKPNEQTKKSEREDHIAVIIPHHDIVAPERATFMKNVATATKNPKKIILISPNHKEIGPNFITTRRTWKTKETNISAETKTINGLIEDGVAFEDDSFFETEHGIRNVIGDIGDNFKNAEIVPLLFMPRGSDEELKKLEEKIFADCAIDCILVASIDMSHYQPARVAEVHDDLTMRALRARDRDMAWRTEVDCNSCLAFTIDWAKHFAKPNFNLGAHTNSGDIIGNTDVETTTHIMTFYSAHQTEKNKSEFDEKSTTISIAGTVNKSETKNISTTFSLLGNRALWGTDAAWIFTETDIHQTNIFNFFHTQKPTNAKIGIFIETISSEKDMDEAIKKFKENETKKQSIAIIDFTKISKDPIDTAKKFADAGATLIIGNQPGAPKFTHINNVPTFLSLGNLATQEKNPGLILTIKFTETTAHIVISPVTHDPTTNQPLYARDQEKQRILKSINTSEILDINYSN